MRRLTILEEAISVLSNPAMSKIMVKALLESLWLAEHRLYRDLEAEAALEMAKNGVMKNPIPPNSTKEGEGRVGRLRKRILDLT